MITRSYIPEKALNDDNLNPTEKIVFGVIFGFAERDKNCFLNPVTIGKSLNISDRQVRRIITKLVKLNYLELLGNKHNRQYKVVLEPITIKENRNGHPVQETDIQYKKRTSSANDTYIYNKDNKDNGESNNKSDKKSIEKLFNEPDEEANRRLAEKENKYKNYFLPLDSNIETDNRYIINFRKPLKKYPDIWLSTSELEKLLNDCNSFQVKPKDVLYRIDLRVKKWKEESRSISSIDFASWINSWALKDEIQDSKIKKQAELTNQRFNKTGE